MMDTRQGIALAGSLLVLLLAACADATVSSARPTLAKLSATPSPTAATTETATPAPTGTPARPPTPACTAVTGEVQALQIDSAVMPKPMQFNLYLPPCYDPTRQPGYPVLYLLHGQTYDQGQWLRLGIAEKADALIASGELLPFLVVMPFEEYSLRDPFTTGFDESLADELIPWIDANFNTCTERACREIGGLSRGASWAIHLGFSRWELFGAIGAHSAPPFIGSGERLGGWLEAIPDGEEPRIYMDIGENDPYRGMAADFEKRLSGYGLVHEWILNPGNHSEDYWAGHLEEYLRWYWGEYEFPLPAQSAHRPNSTR